MSDQHTWDERHKLMQVANDADQAERQAMVLGQAPIETGIADESISGVIGEAEVIDGRKLEEWAEEDLQVEGFAGDVIEELKRRARLLTKHYPFVIDGSKLQYIGSVTGVYEFCLAVSLAPNLTTTPLNKLPINFELLSTELARRHMSPRARAVRTGWPSHDRTTRPVQFKALCGLLAEATNEWKWSPREPNPDDPGTDQVKDEGVDFVVWIPFGDSRAGQFFLLGQCSCGMDWDSKLSDITPTKLDKWLNPATYAAFQRGFAVPRHIPGWHVFAEVASKAGVPFDRVRLTLIAEADEHREEVAAHFKEALHSLTQLVFPQLTAPV